MEPWAPVLSVRELSHGCRLSLSGIAHGDGPTLQSAADALVARVLDAALALRDGLTFSPSLPPPHPRLVAFLHEVGARAKRCEDVRELILNERSGAP